MFKKFLSTILSILTFGSMMPGLVVAQSKCFNPFGGSGPVRQSSPTQPTQVIPQNQGAFNQGPNKPHIPGLGPYELKQIEKYLKQAERYGFISIRDILTTLQDAIVIDDEEEDFEDEEEGFLPIELEDLQEIQQAVVTALSDLKADLNVPDATAKKTRQKKSLVRSVIKLLERTKKNLDREIKRKAEEEKFRD